MDRLGGGYCGHTTSTRIVEGRRRRGLDRIMVGADRQQITGHFALHARGARGDRIVLECAQAAGPANDVDNDMLSDLRAVTDRDSADRQIADRVPLPRGGTAKAARSIRPFSSLPRRI